MRIIMIHDGVPIFVGVVDQRIVPGIAGDGGIGEKDRDNGVGIDPEVLHKGREGHWGLFGMKERAERVGGELRVLSRSDGGTEVELSVPSAIAFERQQAGRFTGRLFNLNRKKRQEEEPSSEGKEVR